MKTTQYMTGEMNTTFEIRMVSIAGSKGGIHVKDKPIKIKVAIQG